jgi:hypothetical protein
MHALSPTHTSADMVGLLAYQDTQVFLRVIKLLSSPSAKKFKTLLHLHVYIGTSYACKNPLSPCTAQKAKTLAVKMQQCKDTDSPSYSFNLILDTQL